MITVGIDLSSQPKQSAACEIVWSGGAAVVWPPIHPLSDDRIVEAVQHADVAGIDVPLGWPAPLIDAAQKRGAGTAWPDRPSADFLFRATDAWVRRFTDQQPLSVVADRIGWPAIRAARIVARLAETGIPVDRSGASGRLVEVYPAAALRRWASHWSKYKGVANAASLDALATEVLTRPWLRFADGAREHYWRSDDCFDALIAALLARAHARRLCETVPDDFRERAKIEGWIAVPLPDSLDQLALDSR